VTTMNFVLQGRDQLSRVLDRAGDSATRMGRRLTIASVNSSAAVNRFQRDAANRLAGLQRDTDASAKAFEALKKTTLSLAPAIIPVAAAMAPLVASTAAAGVAVAAYGAALGPQVAAMGKASEAEQKYKDAVEKSGRTSKEAGDAQVEYARHMAKLPPATRTAAAGLSVLKDQYKSWSDGLAKDTMGPVVKGMAVFGGLLPKLTPLVKGTSSELDRMMTLLAGGMQSPGFDRLVKQFSEFSTGVLKRANDGIVNLMRTLDTGKVGGGLSEFMAYARAQGPLVGDVLRNIGTALMNVMKAGADVGVGMLQAVNALAKLVAAVPPGVITVLLQLAVALKVAKLAALGLVAVRGAIAAFGVQLVAMQTAAAATPGRLAATGAAITALSRTAKIAVAGTGIGLLVLALTELANIGKKAPTDMDRMATSMGQFAQSGKLSGEAAKVLSSDFKEFDEALRGMARPGQLDQMQQGFTRFFGQDSTPVKRWKGVLDDVDKSLAGMVKSGNADLAAQAFDKLAARAKSQGMTTGELRKELGDYKQAQADVRFEQELAAQAMGLFGAQAQAVQGKLAAQKQSADGLRQAIIALNDVNRSAYDSQIGFEASLDSLTASFKKHGATLNLDTAAGQANGQAMSQAAKAHDEMLASSIAAGDSLGSMTSESQKLRTEMMRLATDAFDGNRKKAQEYVNTLLGTPKSITTLIKAEKAEAITGLEAVRAAIQATPGAKSVKVDTLNAAAIAALEAVGLKTRKLPDGRTEVFTANGKSLGAIGAVSTAMNNLNGKTAKTFTTHTIRTINEIITRSKVYKSVHDIVGKASGGPIGFADGGGPLRGPGTSTSDSIPLLGSVGEYMIQASSVSKYGVPLMAAINEGRLKLSDLLGALGGSLPGAGRAAGQGLSTGMLASAGGVEASARVMAAAVVTGVRSELQISSPSKKMRALAADTGKGMILGLTGSKAKIAAVAKDLVKDIWAAWKGTKSTKDSRLVQMVNRDTKKLQTLASRRDGLASRIAAAKKYAGELTASARQGAELGSLGLQPEEVSAGSIKAGLGQKLAQIRSFTTYVSMLAKKGLHKGLLRQILNMGPDAGYAYASALVGADKSTFAAINSLQTQIDKSSTSLGRAGADALYDSGKNAGRGFLRGLIDQQKAIEAQMLKIARGMQRAIKKALGIKSPSQVMAQLGRYSTEGLAVGLTQRLPVLDKALGTVAGRVAATRPVIGRPAVAGRGGGSGTVVHLHLTIQAGPASDPQAIWRATRKGLLELKRDMGGTSLGLA
jgi:hypothetical protein